MTAKTAKAILSSDTSDRPCSDRLQYRTNILNKCTNTCRHDIFASRVSVIPTSDTSLSTKSMCRSRAIILANDFSDSYNMSMYTVDEFPDTGHLAANLSQTLLNKLNLHFRTGYRNYRPVLVVEIFLAQRHIERHILDVSTLTSLCQKS